MNLRKVRVRMPKAQSGLEVKMKAGLGFNANQLSWPVMAGKFSEPELEARRTLGPTDWDNANLEAELGETAVTDLDGDGIPEHYNIGGKRHYDGGTPLNLPENSFIFSRDITMKIKDKDVLAQFGITSAPKGGMTPADVAKKFNINQYKKVLLDKNTDDLSRKTAEMMISNYNIMLGKLAMVQESMKGFPDGMPMIAMPYLESIGLKPEDFLPKEDQMENVVVDDGEDIEQQTQDMEDTGEQEEPQGDMPMARYGLSKYQGNQGGSSTPKNDNKNNNDVLYVWEVRKVSGKPMFVLVDSQTGRIANDENGRPIQQDNNPKQGDNRTAQEYFDAQNKTDRTKVPLDASKGISNEYDYRMGDNNDEYNLLRKVLEGPNKDKIMTKMMTNYRAAIEEAKKTEQDNATNNSRYVRRLTDAQYDALLNEDQETVYKNFMDYQKQVYAFRNDRKNSNSGYYDQSAWDDNAKNVLYKQTAKELEFTDDEIMDIPEVVMSQAAFRGLVAIQQEDQTRPDKDKVLQGDGYRLSLLTGKVNQNTGAEGAYKYVSAADAAAGNNTMQQALAAVEMTPEKEPDICMCNGKPVTRVNGKCPPCDEPIEENELQQEVKQDIGSPWWLQDIINFTGDYLDYGRIKKYMPWQASGAVDYLEPTFYSPERELAANTEQLQIGADGLSNFASPQSYVSNYSALAGQSSKNAADIMARYNALNVGVANEAAKYNTDIFNVYADRRAKEATELYDNVVTANQQYDNSRNAARQKMRQSFINGITNAMTTQAMNTMYDNYHVDPAPGGRVTYVPGKGGINAIRQADQSAVERKAEELMEKHQGTNMTWDQAIRLAGGYKNNNYYPDPRMMMYPAYMNQQQSDDDSDENTQ